MSVDSFVQLEPLLACPGASAAESQLRFVARISWPTPPDSCPSWLEPGIQSRTSGVSHTILGIFDSTSRGASMRTDDAAGASGRPAAFSWRGASVRRRGSRLNSCRSCLECLRGGAIRAWGAVFPQGPPGVISRGWQIELPLAWMPAGINSQHFGGQTRVHYSGKLRRPSVCAEAGATESHFRVCFESSCLRRPLG